GVAVRGWQAGRLQQPVAFPKPNPERLAKTQHHLPAGPRPASLQERQMPWRGSHLGGQGQLADAAVGAPSAQPGTEPAAPQLTRHDQQYARRPSFAPIPFPGIDTTRAPMTSGCQTDQTQ